MEKHNDDYYASIKLKRQLKYNSIPRSVRLYKSYLYKDKSKGRTTTVTPEWIESNIISKPCNYCGSTEQIGCDRLDNSIGHTTDNCVPCCKTCNFIKNTFFTPEEMSKIGKFLNDEIYSNRKKSIK